MVKLAAARANTDIGRMKKERFDAIEKACQDVMAGKYHDSFLPTCIKVVLEHQPI
jgi:aspartate ammonia-lyase